MNNNKLIIILFLNSLCVIFSFAQSPTIQWQKTYGGSQEDKAYSIQILPGGGYMFVGNAESNDGDVHGNHHTGVNDIWCVSIDDLGNLLGQHCYGGTSDDYGYSFLQTDSNNYVIGCETWSNDGNVTNLHGGSFGDSDYWIFKIDSQGIILWEKCFGGTRMEFLSEISQTNDNGFLITGTATSHDGDVTGAFAADDVWVVKIDQNGNQQWAKSFGGYDNDEGYSGKQTTDGGYLISGQTESVDGIVTGLHGVPGASDLWVFKLDSAGNLLWQKCYGGTEDDFGRSMVTSSDGGFFIIGTTSSTDGDVTGNLGSFDVWVLKADSLGNIEWEKSYGGNSVEETKFASICADGGLLIAASAVGSNGMVSGTNGFNDYWILRIDSIGNLQWAKALGGSFVDFPYSVNETPDGGCIVAGYTQSTDSDITFNHGLKDAWIVKLAPLGLSTSETTNTFIELKIYQNNDLLNLSFFSKQNENSEVVLYDITGKKIIQNNISIAEGINHQKINCGGIAKGIYLLELKCKSGVQREKIFIR